MTQNSQGPSDDGIINLSQDDYEVLNGGDTGPAINGKPPGPAPASGPTISGTGSGNASGPTLSPAKPKRSGFGRKAFWVASAAAIGLWALNRGEDSPAPSAPAPAPVPITSAEPEEPQTPLAFRFLVVTGFESVRVCNDPPSGGPSCIGGFRAQPGSCFQPFTDFNGSAPSNGFLQVAYTEASGKMGTGYIDLNHAVEWSPTKTETTCIVRPAL